MVVKHPTSIPFFAGLALGLVPLLLIAQGNRQVATPGITQQLLISQPLAQFAGKQVTVFTGDFEPGAATPRHRHPGTEILYVLEGNGVMHIEGRESEKLAAGRAVLVEPMAGADHFVHQAVNADEAATMKTLVIVIHDSDTPPALPVE